MSRYRTILVTVLLVALLAGSTMAIYMVNSQQPQPKADPGAYIGVAFTGNTTEQAKILIDKVKDCTNLFILDSGRNPISASQTKVEEVCNYAVSKDLAVIVNVGIKDASNTSAWGWFWNQPSLDVIKQRWTQLWGDKFLGIYYNDEPGGVQLDASWRQFYNYVGENLTKIDFPAAQSLYEVYLKLLAYVDNGTKPTPDDYELEAQFFIEQVIMRDPGIENLTAASITAFTSDYGLYWWDYMGGYNVMFAELGWNVSVPEQIALAKGAARLQNKTWGAMITWKYDEPPYIADPDEIYNQMLLAYQSGAKYIAVFNYPYTDQEGYGTLTQAHLAMLHKLWRDITTYKFADLSRPIAALVLPKNFGWGLRNPNDTIWGFWLTDPRTAQVARSTAMLLDYYGCNLDIVYNDPIFSLDHGHYQHIYYWNTTSP